MMFDLQQPLLADWPGYMLRTIVNGPENRPAAGQLPLPTHWETLFAVAQKQQLAPLLYWVLQKSPPAWQPPMTIRQQLRHQYASATVQALQQEHALRAIVTVLNDSGIRPTLYKGAALAHTLYPTPACRPMGDLDLWVGAEEMAVAQTRLEALGYYPNTRDERPLRLQQQQEGEIQLVNQERSKGTVELHWGVFPGQWLQRVAMVDRKGVSQRRVATELLGKAVYLLENEDAFIQLAIHFGISHQLSRFPLRSLFDMALLDQQQIDWNVIIERTTAWRLTTVMSVVLDLFVSVFGEATLTPAAVDAAAKLRRVTAARPFIQRWRDPAILFSQTKLSTSRSRFFYLLSMIDRPQDIVYLLMRTFWPENQWLAARYGVVNNRVRWQHIRSALQGGL